MAGEIAGVSGVGKGDQKTGLDAGVSEATREPSAQAGNQDAGINSAFIPASPRCSTPTYMVQPLQRAAAARLQGSASPQQKFEKGQRIVVHEWLVGPDGRRVDEVVGQIVGFDPAKGHEGVYQVQFAEGSVPVGGGHAHWSSKTGFVPDPEEKCNIPAGTVIEVPAQQLGFPSYLEGEEVTVMGRAKDFGAPSDIRQDAAVEFKGRVISLNPDGTYNVSITSKDIGVEEGGRKKKFLPQEGVFRARTTDFGRHPSTEISMYVIPKK